MDLLAFPAFFREGSEERDRSTKIYILKKAEDRHFNLKIITTLSAY